MGNTRLFIVNDKESLHILKQLNILVFITFIDSPKMNLTRLNGYIFDISEAGIEINSPGHYVRMIPSFCIQEIKSSIDVTSYKNNKMFKLCI